MRSLLRSQDASELSGRSEYVLERLLAHPKVQQAQVVLSYWSLPSEAPTHLLNEHLAASKKLLLPVIDGNDLYLSSFQLGGTLVAEGIYGIPEPTGAPFTAFDQVDLVLVPGLAFGPKGTRCGKGKGYYDRTLARLRNAYTIGLGFDFQLLDNVPMDVHDVLLDEIVTV